MATDNKVAALADAIYAEKYAERVREAGRQKNPGAWVACFHLRRRAYDEAHLRLTGVSFFDPELTEP